MASELSRLRPDVTPEALLSVQEGHAEAAETRKRRIYLWILCLAAMGAGAGLLADRIGVAPSDGLAALWGLTAAWLVGLAVAVHGQRLATRVLERMLLFSSSTLMLTTLTYWMHLASDAREIQTGVMVVLHWVPMIFFFCFITYGGRQALMYSSAIFGLVVLITASAPARPELLNPYFNGPVGLVHVYVAYAVLLACLRFFSDLRQRASVMEEAARSMRRLAHTDPLTGLANRRQMETLLHRELQRAARYGRGFALIMMDVDAFKSLNDLHGHQVGDQVLIDLATQVRAKVRSTDTAARWGGEEFLVLAPETGSEEAMRMAEALRVEIETQRLAGQQVTISLGVTTSLPGDDVMSVLARADAALYQAKNEGRNTVGGVREG